VSDAKYSKSQRGRKAYYSGILAEYIAIVYLILKGYRIIKYRFKNPLGEIDIIAKKNKVLVAVEVKSRVNKNAEIGDVVIYKQRKRNIAGIQWFLSKYSQYQNYDIRFDIVLIKKYSFPKHLLNAYDISGQ